MPRDGAVTLCDLRQRGMDRVSVACKACGRNGSYRLDAALDRWCEDQKLTDLLTLLTVDCQKGKGAAIMDQCGARFVGL